MVRALVVGEALVDVVVGPDGAALGRHPGGSPANVALGLARLGHRAELLTWLGPDEDGDLVRAHLAASGVGLVDGSGAAAATSTATARLDLSGVATYDFDLDPSMPAVDLDALTGDEGFDVVHTGSIAAVLAPGASVVEGLISRTRHRATVSYDPNARPALMGDADVALAKVLAYVGISDVVKVSDEDLAWLRPGVDPLDVAGSWLMRGAAVVVVTRGEGGADALTAAGHTHVDSPATDVVDTVGAGDSFMSGLLDGFARHGLLGADRRDALRAVPDDTVRDVLTHAARIASITCSRPGADPPWQRELEASDPDD
ncbi:carbohydrate kinase family protein [Aquipuribacter sp. MA13-6]|uniref:carbohydrate kinase family protein n=1 Tax=unclassified Aquipuribacter TaxID=2635084 RepID=UPI003EEF2E75